MFQKMFKILKLITLFLIININVYSGDFIEIGFSDFIRFVSSETEENYIIDKSVNDKISIFLPSDYVSKDTKTVLDVILKNNDLTLTKINSINYITKLVKPLMYSYDTKYLQPNIAIDLLKKNFKDINFNYVNKRIIFETNKEVYAKIKIFLDLIDIPVLHRNLKISLIYFNTDDLREYGVNLSVNSDNNSSLSFKSFINQLVTNQQISFFSDSHSVNMFFTDLQKNNKVDFKFSPVVTVFNGNDTVFDIVKNIPYMKQSSQSSSTVQTLNNAYDYKDIGTKINIADVSITDTEIYFKIELTYEILLDNSLTPKTSKRYISNYLKINRGDSVLISGLNSDETTNNTLKVPFLSNIPYLGKLFEYEYNSKTNETFAIYIEDINNINEANALKGVPPL